MTRSQTPAQRPRPEEYRTGAEFRWARRQWKRAHGGSLLGTLAIAVFFGALTGSQALLWGLIGFAIVAHVIARSRP
jgi:predicted lipid-binding transport protein (Tim44 family)